MGCSGELKTGHRRDECRASASVIAWEERWQARGVTAVADRVFNSVAREEGVESTAVNSRAHGEREEHRDETDHETALGDTVRAAAAMVCAISVSFRDLSSPLGRP